MSDEPIIEDAVAIVPVRDIRVTTYFYEDVLDFERRFVSDDESFAIVVHGDAAVHFVKTADEAALQATANNISVYLWVRSVDQLYDRYRARLEALPADRVRPPFDQPYGMREFHVKDPDGCLLLFGEPVQQ